MKKVSIIMATYNTSKDYLFECINSILEQTYKDFELIIICDGSNEEYNMIKTKYSDDRIRVYLNKKNRGLPYSLNKALKLSTGDYIARMDSDDICFNDRIEKQVLFLNKNKDIYICGTNAVLFGNFKGIKSIVFNKPNEIKCQMLFKATLIHPTVMIRRELFDEYKYNEEFSCSQDFELWSRVSKKYRIQILPINGIKYRMHNQQISTQKDNLQRELCKKIINKNTLYVTGGMNDSIVEKTLWFLTGREKITKKDLTLIRDGIRKIINYRDIENKFEMNVLKKILYNRYFELSLKNKVMDISSIRYYLKFYNLKDLFMKYIVYK